MLMSALADGLGHHAEALDAGAPDHVHRLDHRAVGEARVGLEVDGLVLARAERVAEHALEAAGRNALLVQVERAVLRHREDHALLDRGRLGGRARQARPAVARSASGIRGGPTGRRADPCAPIPWKEFMPPPTVPKRRMNGQALAVVARNGRYRSSWATSSPAARRMARSAASSRSVLASSPSSTKCSRSWLPASSWYAAK